MLRQNRVVIDMDAIRNNYQILRNNVPGGVEIMPVIKANAYGHGMLETAQALAGLGVRHFAVALPEEGVELRLAGVAGEVLVLGAAMPRAASDCVRYGLTQTVFTPEAVAVLEREAAAQGREAPVHIKLDTGMNRIGLRTGEEADALSRALAQAPHVRATGVYTHLADADNPLPDGGMNAFTRAQLERFRALRLHFDPSIPAHAANSAMSLLAPEAYFNMIREGISLYGYPPVATRLPFKPALSWYTEIVHVKRISAGESIGYGCAYTAPRDMTVATAAVGYGDGDHRGAMLVRGARAPIVGRICMDQTMLDVTDIPGVETGDEAVILGRQGGGSIGAEELGAWAGTISYEVLLAVTARVPRIYLNA